MNWMLLWLARCFYGMIEITKTIWVWVFQIKIIIKINWKIKCYKIVSINCFLFVCLRNLSVIITNDHNKFGKIIKKSLKMTNVFAVNFESVFSSSSSFHKRKLIFVFQKNNKKKIMGKRKEFMEKLITWLQAIFFFRKYSFCLQI